MAGNLFGSALGQYDPRCMEREYYERQMCEKQQQEYYKGYLNQAAGIQQAAKQQEASKAKAILDKRRKAILLLIGA